MSENDQKEYPVDGNNVPSSKFLPRYFRTLPNKKFLSATFDQMVQTGTAEKLNAYYGDTVAPGYNTKDPYVTDDIKIRNDYQFSPGTVIEDDLGNVNFYKDYIDYINQIKNLKGTVDNHNNLNEAEFYSLNPHIDADKFVNYREYYWLAYGPQLVNVAGQGKEVVSTFTVTKKDNVDNFSYVFSPDGITDNPDIQLIRGQTYTFEIDAPDMPMTIRTQRPGTSEFSYTDGVTQTETGFTFKVPENAPEVLFYVNENDINASGVFKIINAEDNSEVDVDLEVIGKKAYKGGNGVELSNGMKIRFTGDVTPAKYAEGEWYVEGVGDKIVLISANDLFIPTTNLQDVDVPFDANNFDRLPFDDASGFPAQKDYIVGNRCSRDTNYWARSNKWFHKSVIEASAAANKQPVVLNEALKAKKPIIEFNPHLRLHNSGTIKKLDVDLVDTITTDVFSTIEGSSGYNIDGIDIVDGMRILFLGDTDVLVKNKIYEVKFIRFINNRQLTLQPTEDTDPLVGETLLCKQGTDNKGYMYWFDGTTWKRSQEKPTVNQSPLFELYDNDGIQISTLESVSQLGTKIFSYKTGNGVNDPELGFPLSYRSLENIGDIEFEFNLLSDVITYQRQNVTESIESDQLLLRKYSDRENFEYVNAWVKGKELSVQPVIREYFAEIDQTNFDIDVYENSANVTDLWIRVYQNNKLLVNTKDYDIVNFDNMATVVLKNKASENDQIIIKTNSANAKTNNGHYELPTSVVNNPNNENITQLTFGEFTDHVRTIVESLEDIGGIFPGQSNLRDAGNVYDRGTKFVQHSGMFNLANFHLIDDNANIIKAIEFAKREYGKFKREFLDVANQLGFDGDIKDHVDAVLERIAKDKNNSMPFYFSDMIGYGKGFETQHKVFDENNRFYPLSQKFNLKELSTRAVCVYHNRVQIAHGQDYTFNDDGFIVLDDRLVVNYNDTIDIVEYSSTDGSYIPPTPSKFGLFPKYVPGKYHDHTFLEAQNVVQGHDGSITIAYNDFRDDLLVELEMRIFNNIKVEYDESIFNIHDYIGGEYRTTKFSQQQIDNPFIDDFTDWLQLVGNPDYTEYDSFFSQANPFTFNYSASNSANNNSLPGFWRGIYKWAYDTDRPHSHPGEVLGFSIEPNWWKEVYGPRPYTVDNVPLWTDLEKGIVREPGKAVRFRSKFARPGLASFPPADSRGEIQNPLNSGFLKNYANSQIKTKFKFGDQAPTEAAWRRSSDYPFALLKSMIINRPVHTFGIAFDRSRVKRNFAGQLVYGDTNKRIKKETIAFPNSLSSTDRVQTAGLVNYVAALIQNDVSTQYDEYVSNIQRVNNKLGLRVGGFTNKEKFNLLLDSRSPFNTTNVFIPQENYKVFLNKSTAFDVVTYSGVIIEKVASGFIIRGYDRFNPVFPIYQSVPASNDPVMREGGTSENFIDWDENKLYLQGNLVRYEGRFFRAREEHTSSERFDADLFVEVKEVPVVGGVNVTVPQNFREHLSYVDYGTTYATVQEVINFIAGYEQHLIKSGFIFNSYSPESETIQNWRMSMKDYLFWTTQNWQENSVITLSPLAETVKWFKDGYIVDNIFNEIYATAPLNSNGRPINPKNLSYSRVEKEFILQPKDTNEGIYLAKLPLTQKEHIVLLDNKTIFKDVIYNKEQGYRQQRIKVIGYRSSDWDGSINVPGFIIDDVTILDWNENTDYSIGDVVKYKKDYYVAKENVPGNTTLDLNYWEVLSGKPENGLFPNFDYKINQFADFYDLDTDNFDIEQQKVAQHLIGYQKREYLQNILKDDVSQYKFYQGYIQDKGTKNALTKLFDALSSSGEDSLEFYEEWAARVGSYGATDGIKELEFILDESKFQLDPQPIIITNRDEGRALDLVYRQPITDVYLAPEDYDYRNVFPTKNLKQYVPTAGYVNSDDVDYEIATYNDILTLDAASILIDQYVWVGLDKDNDWNVFKVENTDLKIGINDYQTDTRLTFYKEHNLEIGDIFIIATEKSGEEKLVKVKNIENEYVTIDKIDITETDVPIRKFVSKRYTNISNFAAAVDSTTINDLAWVDQVENENTWGVYEKGSYNYSKVSELDNTGKTGYYFNDISSDQRNVLLAVGYTGDNQVEVFSRATDTSNLVIEGNILEDTTVASNQSFGSSVAVSPDQKYIAVGSPDATSIKTNLIGSWNPNTAYAVGDILKHNNRYWTAQRPILASSGPQSYNTYEPYPILKDNLSDSTEANFLVAGNYPLTNTRANHFLIRATDVQFRAIPVGSTLHLHWNRFSVSHINPTLRRDPFEGTVTGLDYNWLTGAHVISDKVDMILNIPFALLSVAVGDILQTSTGEGEINYVYQNGNGFIVYLKNTTGQFAATGKIYNSANDEIGDYEYEIPDDTHTSLGGYWMISTNSISAGGVDFIDVIVDNSPGLIIKDVKQAGDLTAVESYYNVTEDVGVVGTISNGNEKVSLIGKFKDPDTGYPAPSGYEYRNLWFVRLGSTAPTFNIGDSIRLQENTFLQDIEWENEFPIINDNSDPIFDNNHEVVEKIDGYIRIQLQPDQVGTHNFVKGDQLEDANTGAIFNIFHATIDAGFLTQTLYVNIDGTSPVQTFSNGSDYGDSTRVIRRRSGEVNRDAGFMQESSVATAGGSISPLYVFDSRQHLANPALINYDLPVYGTDLYYGAEYWIRPQGRTELGDARAANEPTPNNADWLLTTSIDVIPTGGTLYTGTGFVSVYERQDIGVYALEKRFVLPFNFANVGKNLDFKIVNGTYVLFVGAQDKLLFVKKGTEGSRTFNWEVSLDKDFRDVFSMSAEYYIGDVVIYNAELYRAKTNIASGSSFNILNWDLIDNDIDYTGYVPRPTTVAGNDSSLLSLFTDIDSVAADYELSDNGQVLALYATRDDTDPNVTQNDKIAVYRYVDNAYRLQNVIDIPDDSVNDQEYKHNFSMSSDGSKIAVGLYKSDANGLYDAGKVLVYEYQSASLGWILIDTIISPSNDDSENFGYDVAFVGNSLVVSSLYGDNRKDWTLSDNTTFDNGFTSFYLSDNIDVGSVYVYDLLQGKYIFATRIDTSVNLTKDLRKNGLHLYGLNGHETLCDYKFNNQTIWNRKRQQLRVVDIDKFKGPFLYDKSTKEMINYIDIVDPIQGKIAGPAEQELRFKSHWDPAIFSNADEADTNIIVDKFKAWGPEQTGYLWWDLSTARFKNPYQGSAIYQLNNWNTLFTGASIDVYEWVESDYDPENWTALADTEEGLNEAISGQPKYGIDTYSLKKKYDPITQSFVNKYYFWVKNKKTLPALKERVTTAFDVAAYIADPRSVNYKYAVLLTSFRYAVLNSRADIKDRDTVVNFTWHTLENKDLNIHNQYQLISDGLYTSKPNAELVTKWFDSLVGFDKNLKEVPDPMLSPKLKYGTLSRPRQSWFVNRLEALKVVIERANLALRKKVIVDDFDFTALNSYDEEPSPSSREYDYVVDTEIDLQFIGVNNFKQAVLTPVWTNGRLTDVIITNPGSGYIDPSYTTGTRKGPLVKVVGTGTGAEVECTINSFGSITNVRIVSSGEGYADTGVLSIRGLTALVNADSTINNKWAIAEYAPSTQLWNRKSTQNFDTRLYWKYVDWFASGYNQFTEPTFILEYSYELESLQDRIGDVVKINNVGTGGWLLLKKVDDQDSVDYSVNYETVGRQNGTIEIDKGLYDFRGTISGYDGYSYDITIYDGVPISETRIILETLFNSIFVDDLAIEYNKIFFASIRHIFSEGQTPDWLFKTSFVKAKHNFGSLDQKTHFQNDNLSSYESYIREVKPYKTQIREYISAYNKIDPSASRVTDFDLMPWYDPAKGKIAPQVTQVKDGVITVDNNLEYPWKSWIDNATYYVDSIEVVDGGSNFTMEPQITLEGGGGEGATARAYISRGKITSIEVLTNGSGYVSAPTVVINGSQTEGGTPAIAVSRIENDTVRKIKTTMKFDRTSGEFVYLDLSKTETFTSLTNQFKFDLKWPIDFAEELEIDIDGAEVLSSLYTIGNEQDKTFNEYYIERGFVEFTEPLDPNQIVTIKYNISPALLKASDRVHHFYKPISGMPGYDQVVKDLSQVMQGIDYGGVEITSFDFDTDAGWDSDGWYTSAYDQFDGLYEDIVFRADGSTRSVTLTTPLELGTVYNLYLNGVKVDDPNFGTAQQTNINALGSSITGDGTSTEIDVSNYNIQDGDVFIIRKITSDGTFIPDGASYDAQLSGGNFSYGNAKGITAGEIIVDGDGFVTPTTSRSTDEHVPGQVLDTVDIKVYERISNGQGVIVSRIHYFNADEEEQILATKQSELASLNVDYTTEESDLESFNSQLATLQTELATLETERDNLQAYADSIDLTTSEYLALQSEKTDLEDDIATAQSELSSLQSQLSTAQGDLANLESQKTSVDSQLVTAQQNLATAQGELSSLQQQLSAAQADLQNYLPSDPEYGQIQALIQSLQSQITAKNGQISNLQSQISSLQSQSSSLASQIASKQSEVTSLQGQVTSKNTQITSLQNDLQTVNTEISDYQQAYNLALADVSAKEGEISNKETDISIKQGQIATQNTLVSNIENAIAAKEVEVDQAQAAIDALLVDYDIGITPLKQENLIVRFSNGTDDNRILDYSEYTVNYSAKTISLKNAPPSRTTINTLVVGSNGSEILDSGRFIGDGSTTEFLTKLTYQENLQAVITVNGIQRSAKASEGKAADVEILMSSDDYELENAVLLSFGAAPKAGDYINYIIFGSDTETFSEVIIDDFQADGSTATFELTQQPYNKQPADIHTLVLVGNNVLDTGYNTRFNKTSAKFYPLSQQNIPYYSKNPQEIIVYANGILQTHTESYRWYTENSTLELFDGKFATDDVIEVYTKNENYEISNSFITLSNIPTAGTIKVFQFSNHDLLEIKRSTQTVLKRATLVVGTDDWREYSDGAIGRIRLENPVINENYVWIALNGTLLSPNTDYGLLPDYKTVEIYKEIQEGNEIDVIHFSGDVSSERFGYKQFKDILNRTHYKRINAQTETVLDQPLAQNDLRIYVKDGSKLDEPNKKYNLPGILFVNGERIEYFVKEGNVLRQIKRATLGTGINKTLPVGTIVSNLGAAETVPYQDKTLITEFTSDGSSADFELDFSAQYGVNQFEVFVEGKRLRKTAIEVFDPAIDIVSPQADVTHPAEFSVHGTNDNILRLLNVPDAGTKIKVVRKIGSQWRQEGVSMKSSKTYITDFLRKGTTGLPE